MNQTVLSYLTKVLGVKEILRVESQAPTPQFQIFDPDGSRLCCIFPAPLSQEEESLFQKMMTAIKLAPSEISRIEGYDGFAGDSALGETLEKLSASVVLCMTETSDAGGWTSIAGKPVLKTFHPKILLEQPQLKREAWDHLKDAMRKLAGEN